MKDEENKMQSAAPEQQAQPGTENEPKAETTAPETPDKKKRPLWRKLLAVFAAALAVGAFQSALSLGVAVVAITAGIAAMMMAINSAEKRVNQMNAATQQSLSPSTYGGVSGRSASIPALATGAVIPPNGEFLAVLGDQKKGRNLEAPENLIRQIVREESGGGLSGTLTIRPAPGLTRYLAYELKREDARAGTPLVEGTRR